MALWSLVSRILISMRESSHEIDRTDNPHYWPLLFCVSSMQISHRLRDANMANISVEHLSKSNYLLIQVHQQGPFLRYTTTVRQ